MKRYSINTQSVIRISKIPLKNNRAAWMYKSMFLPYKTAISGLGDADAFPDFLPHSAKWKL